MNVIVLYIVLLIASVWDFRTHKIPNALSISGVILGLVFSYIEHGLQGFGTSALSILICLILLFLIWALLETFRLSIFGAGDMKLLIAISAFLGIKGMFEVFYLSIIVGGIWFLFLIPFKQTVSMFSKSLYFLFYAFPLSKENHTARLSFSFPLLLSCLITQSFF